MGAGITPLEETHTQIAVRSVGRQRQITQAQTTKFSHTTHHPFLVPHPQLSSLWEMKIGLKCLLLNTSGETPGNGLNCNFI